jgi:hypothetical protein
MRRTLDWSLSCVGDDVTAYTDKLTEMERRLFSAGSKASAEYWRWKVYGFSKRGKFFCQALSRAPPPLNDPRGGDASEPLSPDQHRRKRARAA